MSNILVISKLSVPYSFLANTTITIRGRVIFPRIPGKLPEGSCLNVRFSDTSMQDASSIELASAQLNVSGMNMAKQFNFMLESNKPAEEENWRTLSIDAVLNVGWCPSPDSDEWVRKGDYLTDTNFRISMTHELVYDKDLPVICYCKLHCLYLFWSVMFVSCYVP